MAPVPVIAVVAVAVTVVVHAYGLSLLLPMLGRARRTPPTKHWPITWLLVRLACLLILLHVIEIALWALLYLGENCLADAETAIYFSGVTYTTLGYGDVVLPEPWRMLAPVQALTGILMCGLSAGVFFATVNRIYTSSWGEGHASGDRSGSTSDPSP